MAIPGLYGYIFSSPEQFMTIKSRGCPDKKS
jgi:hypothetical protein